jgi:hypothetical protein
MDGPLGGAVGRKIDDAQPVAQEEEEEEDDDSDDAATERGLIEAENRRKALAMVGSILCLLFLLGLGASAMIGCKSPEATGPAGKTSSPSRSFVGSCCLLMWPFVDACPGEQQPTGRPEKPAGVATLSPELLARIATLEMDKTQLEGRLHAFETQHAAMADSLRSIGLTLLQQQPERGLARCLGAWSANLTDRGVGLRAASSLLLGEYIRTADCKHYAVMQADCNLVVYRAPERPDDAGPGVAIWGSGTQRARPWPVCRAAFVPAFVLAADDSPLQICDHSNGCVSTGLKLTGLPSITSALVVDPIKPPFRIVS